MIKDIEYIIKKIFISDSFLLKKRLKRAIKKSYEKELSITGMFADQNKDAVDVGVYRGVYSYKLSKEFKNIYSFEPNPLIFPFLKKNLPKIINNIKLYNCALSDKEGFAELKIPLRSKSFFKQNYENLYQLGAASIHKEKSFEKFHTVKVQKHKLDDLLLNKNIGFIKIDVEGHEKEVIDGSRNIITKNRPTLLVEIEERHSKKRVVDTINYINKLGYKSYFLLGNELIETQKLTTFKSVNNFIFKSQ